MKKTSKVLLGLGAAFAAGTVLGLLYAPEKGERTRRKLARKKQELEEWLENTRDAMEDTIDKLRDKAGA